MAVPTNIKTLLSGNVVEWARIEFYRVFNRRYRNRRIGESLKEMHLTEGRNTGFRKILNALERNGSPRPIFETDPERLSFCTTLLIHPLFLQADGEINDGINDGINIDLIVNLSDVERLVIEAVSVNPSVSVAKMVADFSIPRASVERAVKSLKEKELLARVGSRKSGKWVILKQGHDGL